MAHTNSDPAEAKGLQWGGRFASAPDAALLAFGSSLAEDLVLAPFDVRCSRAHVTALESGRIVGSGDAARAARCARSRRRRGRRRNFAAWATTQAFEDVHGAIDARVREHAGPAGERLHAGRSRNDQVATTLLLYARDRAHQGAELALDIAALIEEHAAAALERRTVLAATTHWQPAQPVLLAFWLDAAAQAFVRAAERFARVASDAARFCPLGSAALAGSSLPLDRDAAARELGFGAPSRNALDAVGDRDVVLDLLHAAVRAAVAASRPSEELVIWATPAFGYVRLDDAASTGSSLMPQKRNPDPFELVRAAGARAIGVYAGALASTNGIALSYHRDLQETKAQAIAGTEAALAALDAFRRAFAHVHFNDDGCERARSGRLYGCHRSRRCGDPRGRDGARGAPRGRRARAAGGGPQPPPRCDRRRSARRARRAGRRARLRPRQAHRGLDASRRGRRVDRRNARRRRARCRSR